MSTSSLSVFINKAYIPEINGNKCNEYPTESISLPKVVLN